MIFKLFRKAHSVQDPSKTLKLSSLLRLLYPNPTTHAATPDPQEKITSSSDVNELYYFCKFFCQLIINSNSEEEYNKKIPVYLFKEKKTLIDIYKKFSFKKKKLLLNLLYSTEKTLRKESGLSLISGLRFLLTIKKITIS